MARIWKRHHGATSDRTGNRADALGPLVHVGEAADGDCRAGLKQHTKAGTHGRTESDGLAEFIEPEEIDRSVLVSHVVVTSAQIAHRFLLLRFLRRLFPCRPQVDVPETKLHPVGCFLLFLTRQSWILHPVLPLETHLQSRSASCSRRRRGPEIVKTLGIRHRFISLISCARARRMSQIVPRAAAWL